MFLYITFFILLALFTFVKPLQNKRIAFIILILLCLFVCFGYMTGSDWRAYELRYEDYKNGLPEKYFNDIGYVIYSFLFYKLGVDFWIFLIFTKCVCFFISIYYLRIYTKGKYQLGLLLFYCLYALFFYIDNPLRNLISGTIFLVSYKYIYERKQIKFLICVLFAALFHLSAILVLPVYYIYIIKFSKKRMYIVIASIFLFSFIFNKIFYDLARVLSLYSSIVDEKTSFYLSESPIASIFSLGMALRLFLVILIIEKQKQLIRYLRFGDFFVKISFIFVCYTMIGYAIPIMGRMQLFLFLPFIACCSVLPFTFSIRGKYKIYLLSFSIAFFTMITSITASYRYIPYSNYLSYLFKDKPNYQERSIYNFMNSPYNKDK